MHTRPLLPSDIPTVASIAAEAFQDDPLFEYLHPYSKQYPEDWHNYMTRRVWLTILAPASICIVAVADEEDTTSPFRTSDGYRDPALAAPRLDEVIGYVFITRHAPLHSTNKPSPCHQSYLEYSPFSPLLHTIHSLTLSVTETLHAHLPLDRSVDHARQESFRTLSGKQQASDFLPLEDTHRWHLRALSVRPCFQRRGIGLALVRSGVRMAEREGVPLYLRASEAGEGVYARAGCVGVGWSALVSEEDLRAGRAQMWARVMVFDPTGRYVSKVGWVERRNGGVEGVGDEKDRVIGCEENRNSQVDDEAEGKLGAV